MLRPSSPALPALLNQVWTLEDLERILTHGRIKGNQRIAGADDRCIAANGNHLVCNLRLRKLSLLLPTKIRSLVARPIQAM